MSISPGKIAVSDVIASAALEALNQKIVIGNLVSRDAETDYVPGVGSTVNVRIPTKLTAHDVARGGDMPSDSLDEKVIPVTLDVHAVSQVHSNAHDVTLDIKNYAKQVVGPQVDAVAGRIEKRIAAELDKVVKADGTTAKDAQGQLIAKPVEHKPADAFSKALIAAGEVLDGNDVPLEKRILVVNPKFRAAILSDPLLVADHNAGTPELITDGASRLATNYMGKRYGFDVYLSTAITGAVAFTAGAFTLANVAPRSNVGGAQGRQVKDGYALRHATGFDPKKAADFSHLDAFCGAAVMDAKRCIGITVKAA
ncbi:hypothetical protein GCM10010329_28840 [Streptomyces spiroverticillatus]|uniref:P22 coat protein-protein 5 domain protein n=1 Tax=Streptomyces finlayi TaxID=67296 RepID=A0A918WVT7_9ACTN|nr:P22 phage major capsid protein family protein [Streptomyces finlayi]GHA04448.1 hypothetical protein GCM10010329_28840 [Streptomyces spiroverticillatus]GHC88501.1 hypothetical protein GCM10010334_21250 [Streptomyces finlayi]